MAASPQQDSATCGTEGIAGRKSDRLNAWGNWLGAEAFGKGITMYRWYLAVVGCILVADWNAAAKAVGLQRSAFDEGIKRLYQTGEIKRKARPVPPSVYTPEVMKLAYDLLHDANSLMNFKDLFHLVREYGFLTQEGCLHRFRKAFKLWCKAQGTPLTVNSVGTVFYLPDGDFSVRKEYAEMVLEMLQRKKDPVALDQLIFVDEVTLEECSHPKGEPPDVYACMLLAIKSDKYT